MSVCLTVCPLVFCAVGWIASSSTIHSSYDDDHEEVTWVYRMASYRDILKDGRLGQAGASLFWHVQVSLRRACFAAVPDTHIRQQLLMKPY
jgi:hypothetical protein